MTFNPSLKPQKLTSIESYLVNKSKSYAILGLIQGEMQIGKSTLLWMLANNISLLKDGVEWDYKKYCARSFNEFLDMVDRYDNKILAVEEAGRTFNISTWYDQVNKLMNLLITTQAYKHNIYILVLPCGLGLPNAHRRFVNIGIEVLKRWEALNMVSFRATVYKRRYWKLIEDDIWYNWLPTVYHIYNGEELRKATEFTDWLIEFKKDIMSEIKNEARNDGFNPKKPMSMKNCPDWVMEEIQRT